MVDRWNRLGSRGADRADASEDQVGVEDGGRHFVRLQRALTESSRVPGRSPECLRESA